MESIFCRNINGRNCGPSNQHYCKHENTNDSIMTHQMKKINLRNAILLLWVRASLADPQNPNPHKSFVVRGKVYMQAGAGEVRLRPRKTGP